MPGCIFCRIASGELPSTKVYEDEQTLAFLDITPINPGHTLVIPKKHATDVFEIEEDEWVAIMKTARKVAHALEKALGAHGVNVDTNNREAAGQVVFHSHVHVIPRFEGDGFTHWKGKSYAEGEAAKVSDKIRAAL
jgi:histidine triad (HIT) family protein